MSENSARDVKIPRKHRRYAVKGGVLQVFWLDKTGAMRETPARAVDVSEDGISFELPEEVMPLLIRFQSDRFNVKGKGAVRHCRRVSKKKFVVGLEFTGDLHWRAPEGDVRKPIPLCGPSQTSVESITGFPVLEVAARKP